MSRLTGSDALGLYEAYQAVYNPQELTEEQVWEEVETWVNSLLEEGYDLSDYTWEEMYEDYLEEHNPVTPVIDKEKPVITKQKPVTPTATATARSYSKTRCCSCCKTRRICDGSVRKSKSKTCCFCC
jgi:hypothetical protein